MTGRAREPRLSRAGDALRVAGIASDLRRVGPAETPGAKAAKKEGPPGARAAALDNVWRLKKFLFADGVRVVTSRWAVRPWTPGTVAQGILF